VDTDIVERNSGRRRRRRLADRERIGRRTLRGGFSDSSYAVEFFFRAARSALIVFYEFSPSSIFLAFIVKK